MMKIFLSVILCVLLFVPLFAQEDGQVKKPFTFARQHFEFGIESGFGMANDLLAFRDFLKRDIVIDLNKLEESIQDDGANLKITVFGNSFLNIMNLGIFGGRWDFGVFSGADGNISGNLPKSIFTLIGKGNINQHTLPGSVRISGGIFAETGFKAAAKYSRFRVALTPALYAPLLYVPKSGINYILETDDGVSLRSDGAISVYSPFIDNGEIKFGFDLSTYGEFSLFSFLDIGGRISHVPMVPAVLNKRMRLTMTDIDFAVSGQDLIDGKEIDFPGIDFAEEYDSAEMKVVRPLRFDLYARFRPFGPRLLSLTPNLGFTADISEGEEYFNAGLEFRLNLVDLFIPYLSVGREEGLWRNQIGFALNFRVFELDLEASLQSQTFKGCFSMKGFALGLGLRFGW